MGTGAGKLLQERLKYFERPDSYNLGSVHSYTDTGLTKCIDATIDGETRRFVLAGVRVDKPSGCATGTSGRLAVSTEENNLVMPSGTYATIDSSLSDAFRRLCGE